MTQSRKTSIMKMLWFGLLAMIILVSCVPGSARPTETPVPSELVLYNWVEYMPQSVIEAFQKEYGITVKYVAYETQEEVVKNLQKGNAYDLVVLGP